MYAKLIGTGSYLPETVVTNQDLEEKVDTTDEWIQQRVGIQSRHVAGHSESTASMATAAAKEALEMAGLKANEIDLILVATSTADYLMPSVACEVQNGLGVSGSCAAFDICAACSGFLYGLNIVEQYFKAGSVSNILVVGVERMSRVMDWKDRSTCVLFGDGAGAAVFTSSQDPGLYATAVHADGKYRDLLYVDSSLSDEPFNGEPRSTHLKMEGNRVFKFAVNTLKDVADDVLKRAGLSQSQLDWLVPHQANERIITATAKKLGMSLDKVILTLAHQGNTSAASVPLALDSGIRKGQIKSGQNILFEAFGAGFTWGGALLKF